MQLKRRAVPLLAIALLSALPSFSFAQNKRPQENKQSAKPVAPAGPVYRDVRIEAIDVELGALLQLRGDTTVDQAMLEVQIDLRLFARSVAAGLGEKLEAKPEQASAYFRLNQLLAAATALATDAKPLTVLSPAQQEALKKLHGMTYTTVDASNVAALDAVCKDIAAALSTIVPAPPIPMRPASVIASTQAIPHNTVDNSLASLRAQAQRINVMPLLRRQLLSLSDAAQSAATTGDAAETRQLTAALSDSVDLSNGLATNTAVDIATRQQIESQLAEGIAMFIDTRTREIGRKRLKLMAPYRQTLVRVGRIKENPEANKLGKLFVWAQENPEEGAKALSAVEAYNRVVAEYEARETIASLPPNVKRATVWAMQQFANARATFLTDARELGEGGVMGPSVGQLDEGVTAMTASLELIGLIETTPKSVDQLLAYKPRPVTGLEKRVIASLLGVMSEGKVPPDEATATLKALKGLAEVSSRIGTDLNDAVPVPTATAWAGGQLPRLEVKLRTTITEAATALASGNAVEPTTIARLNVAGDVCDALKAAQNIDDAITQSAPLVRWVDWNVPSTGLDAIIKPYRDATAAAVSGLVNDSTGEVEGWPKIARRYRPLVAYIRRMSEYAPACAALPEGAAGAIAQLATPLAFDKFGDVRLSGFALGLWSAAELNADITTTEVAAGMLSRLVRGP